MLEANPALTWRDIKHILATTADQIGSDSDYSYTYTGIKQYEWVENTAGYKHHIWFGFGKIDAAEAINTAKTYTANSRGTFSATNYIQNNSINQVINWGVNNTSTLSVTKPVGSNDFVEFVRVTVQFDHSVPKSVGLRLQSPEGTIVNIMQPFTNIGTNPSTTIFDIGVSAFYGENIEGNWTIAANDYVNDSQSGTLLKYGIQIYGN